MAMMVVMMGICCLYACCILLFFSTTYVVAASHVTNNPADQLVAELNNNRTAQKGSSALPDNAGLACIALQYIKAYQGSCGEVGGDNAKKPADSEIAETFAPNCGVIASSLKPITGRLLGCQSKYVQPKEAFSILVANSRAVEIVHSKNHSEVGAAVSGSDGGSPYFWCVLFSNGTSNSSFSFEGGQAKLMRPGCFSGANDECSGADSWSQNTGLLPLLSGVLIAMYYAFVV